MRSNLFLPFLLVVFAALPSSAATFTVTSSADSGPGTLRQAILDANANPGLDQIRFTTDVSVNVGSSLPPITDPVDIDGLRGSSRTRITGTGVVDGFRAFFFQAGSSGSTVRNVWIRTFAEGVRIDSGVTNVLVEDNFVEAAINVFGNTNTIRDNARVPGLLLASGGATGNVLTGNQISNVHLLFAGSGNRIGSSGSGNSISLLTVESTAGTIVEGNTAGTIRVFSAVPLATNTLILLNTVSGVIEVNPSATGVDISQNSVTGGQPVDLNGEGPTPNDPAPDADTGGNNLQNYPVLATAVVQSGQLTVTGTLTSAPSTEYRIELFSNDAADPAMRTYLGAFTVTTDAAGNVAFTRAISPLSIPTEGEVVTATAMNTTTSDTSEVSAPATVTVVAAAVTPVPTLSEWALIALAGALLAIVLLRLR